MASRPSTSHHTRSVSISSRAGRTKSHAHACRTKSHHSSRGMSAEPSHMLMPGAAHTYPCVHGLSSDGALGDT
ncbi:hypothetical protein EUGRSUZ_B01583 [Eucalyptus grandis]|uniref:Uncharacterized protein n=2 Tax=Eucalyptus grandis TaxID=71139 RepID=A0ACC3LQ47_EUCGR|nr:hypothetical protein EUGRSUZ_B01583 [Eucalyptus grandis]